MLLGLLATPAARAQCQPDWVALPSMAFGHTGFLGPYTHPLTFRVLPNGDLLAGGSFDFIGGWAGVSANNIARWNGANWTNLGSGLGGSAYATEVMGNGDIIVGGRIETAGGLPAMNVARWDGAAWHALGAGVGDASTEVLAMARLPNGDLVVGGTFTSAGGAPASRLARWDGTSWSTFGPPGLSGSVNAMTILASGDLVVGGTFTSPFPNLMIWNGTAWSGLGGGTNGAIRAFVQRPNGDLWVGGEFTIAAGQPTRCVASWNGSAWTTYPNGPQYPLQPARVSAMTLDAAGNVVVGGRFFLAGGVSANNVAKWDGTSWSALGNGPGAFFVSSSQEVLCLANAAGAVWAGGLINNGLQRWTCPTGLADFTPVGHACGYGRQSFYERFNSPLYSPFFDLADSTLHLTRTSFGFAVSHVPGTPSMDTPTPGSQLALTDDSVTAPLPLPFSVSYPGGTTSQVVVGSNGYVYLQPSSEASAFYDNIAGLLNGAPRLAAVWGDLDPVTGTGSGTIHFHVDATNLVAYATWQGVQEWLQPGSLCTFQIAMFANGDVEFRYQACTLAHPAVTGWSPGNGAADPGHSDLNFPGGTFTTWPIDFNGPTQGATTRPILNSTWSLETRGIANSSVLGLEILGLTNPNIPDLSFIGMQPFCGLFASLDVVNLFLPNGPTHPWSLAIPGSASLIGVHVYAASAAWVVPSGSLFGLFTANGIDGVIGNP